MNLGREIEHGGYPTSETRTISLKRRDASLYAGIGSKKGWRGTQKVVDSGGAGEVESTQSHGAATETKVNQEQTMTLTFKSLSKNGRNAFYSGAAVAIRIPLTAFPNKTAPQSIEVADGAFAPAKQPKPKMTAEERKAARAAKPKPTLAEQAERARIRAEKLAAKAKAAEAGNDPQL